LGVKLVEVLVKGTSGATLTVKRGHNIKVSRGVRDDRIIGKDVKSLRANGINTKTSIESEVSIKKIVYGAGRHRFEVVVFLSGGGGSGRKGYARRESRG
jgi:hypothetical protein